MLYNQTIIENLGYMDRITKATFPMIDKYESNDRYYEILRIVEYYNMGRIFIKKKIIWGEYREINFMI